ncbi:hypothetical protein PV327_000052 [Microctonus hyperodae]|uniref:Uncharacterized protein n=1 Tax=Microctonus hyperodae TaxID=165561 RepID=A0AA39G694_MICHY|nr:hypothetical protein PV327_000052 [Microctonus hyperodae]
MVDYFGKDLKDQKSENDGRLDRAVSSRQLTLYERISDTQHTQDTINSACCTHREIQKNQISINRISDLKCEKNKIALEKKSIQ